MHAKALPALSSSEYIYHNTYCNNVYCFHIDKQALGGFSTEPNRHIIQYRIHTVYLGLVFCNRSCHFRNCFQKNCFYIEMVTRQILSAFAAVGELYKLPDSKSPHPTRLHSLKSVCVKKIFFPHLFCRSMKPDIRNNNFKNTQIPLELFCVSNVCRNSFLVHVWGPRLLVYHMGDTVWHKDSLLKSSWQSLQSTKYDSKHTT